VEINTDSIQNNFLSGVLDPRAQGRVDTSAYISSLLVGTNVEMVHLGGVQRRRGLVQRFVMPNKLTLLTASANNPTYTVPNGPAGASNLGNNNSQNNSGNGWTTTTAPSTTNPWVLVEVDLGTPQNVLFADVLSITLASGSSTQFCIQHSNDGSTWTTLGTAFPQLDSTALYTYRRCGGTGGGVTYPATYTSARYWRVAKIGGTALASEVTFSDFVLWGDTGTVSEGRLVPFEVSTGEQYMVAISDHSGIVYCVSTNEIVDYVALPYASVDLPLLDAQSSAESMMIVQKLYPPQFLVRVSSPLATGEAYQTFYNFQTFYAEFSYIPKIDYADSLSPTPTSDLQTLTFNSGWNVGDTFTITIQTDTTGPITYAGDNQTTANAIATAVQALWVVNGFTGVSCTSNGSYGYTLTFAEDAAAPIGAIAITSLSSSATATAAETQVGVSRQENAWSETRGYPSVVTYFQGRLYMGGLQSQQETLVGSWVNDVLNFDTAQGLDDQAIYATLNGVALNAVTALFPGRSLCVFTTGGEFRFDNDNGQAVTPTSFPANQTQYGTAQIKPVMIDGNIVFVQRNRNSIRDFQFDYTQDQFNSLGLSSFAGNLVYDVQDMAGWNGSADEEINLIFVVNGTNPNTNSVVNPNSLPDGSCAVYNTRKEANVQGWTFWETTGTFENVGTILDSVCFLVQRELTAGAALVFEQAVEGTFTDCGTGSVTLENASSSITGLNWLAGLSVRAIADGYVLDTTTVSSGGVVTLTRDGYPYAATTYEIGLNFNPTISPMPLQKERWPNGSNLAKKKRIKHASVRVQNTLGLLYTSTDGTTQALIPTQQIDTFDFDTAPVPFSGILDLEDASVWDRNVDKAVSFTQVDPVPLYLMYIDMELSSEQT
jgi:hypothetical protein